LPLNLHSLQNMTIVPMNCIIVDDDKLSLKILSEFVKKTDSLDLVGTFENAIDAINSLKKNELTVDLIFLDIEMPEMSGIDFLKTLQDPPQIIIVSGKDNYALHAFEFNVVDYLLKPIAYARFYKAVDKALGNHNRNIENGQEELFIKRNNSLVRIKYEDILWVEALENYVTFNTYRDKFTVHFTIKSVCDKLNPKKFFRVHRSFVVNISSIEYIEENSIYLRTIEGIKAIPIGKSYRDDLLSELNLISN